MYILIYLYYYVFKLFYGPTQFGKTGRVGQKTDVLKLELATVIPKVTGQVNLILLRISTSIHILIQIKSLLVESL